jgi:MFS transporter, putative metabolite:H+ symporter
MAMGLVTAESGSGLIAARIDRLPRSALHRRLMLFFALPLFFDSCDINTFPSAAPALMHAWGMSINQVAIITSASFLGMFVGATLGGLISDRIGRRWSLLSYVMIASLGSLITAAVPGPATMFLARIVTGIGISAGMVTVMTYISELFPAKSRGTWQSWAMVINLCAIPITNFVARLVVPLGPDSWRLIFVWGALGLLFLLIIPHLPESPRWLERQGRTEEADAIVRRMEAAAAAEHGALPPPLVLARVAEVREPWTAMFGPLYRRRTLVLCAIWLLQTIGFYGFEAWVPTLLVQHGITLTRSLTYFALINVGAPLGALVAVAVADRFERKHTLALVAFAVAVCGLLYGLSFEPALIVGFGFMVGMLVQTFATLLYSYTPEQFPTGLRNSATGLTYGAGRIANVLNAFIIAGIYQNFGYISVFAYIAGAWLLTAFMAVAFGPRTTGRSLELLNPAPDAGERLGLANPVLSE